MKHSREFPVPLEHAFDAVLHCSLPDIFTNRAGAIPPIREVRHRDGGWGTPGQARTIVLADGSSMVEELMTVERPRRFSYRISGIKGMLKPLVAHAEGVWTFESVGECTRITWQWTVQPDQCPHGPRHAPAGPDVADLRLPRDAGAQQDPEGVEVVRRLRVQRLR